MSRTFFLLFFTLCVTYAGSRAFAQPEEGNSKNPLPNGERIGGGVILGPDAAVCTSANAGEIIWDGSAFLGCDGKAWKVFGLAPPAGNADGRK